MTANAPECVGTGMSCCCLAELRSFFLMELSFNS